MLKEEIEETRKNVKTDRLQLSIGELASMYENSEFNIQPDFQRLFRWSKEKKSSLIESILIDVPIPSIFTYENEDGSWELVDGLQRISTLFEFMRILKNSETGEYLPPISLRKTKYLPSLENAVWEKTDKVLDTPLDDQAALDRPQQLAIRRARLDVQVLKQPSDKDTKFHLFQRLNRGGAYANEQEVRTCAMVMVDPDYVKTIKTMATNPRFRKMAAITEDGVKRQYDVELIVRMIVHTLIDFKNQSDVQDFLDEGITEVMNNHPASELEKFVEPTLDMLYDIFGEKALYPHAGQKPQGESQGRFSLRAWEAVVVGIARNFEAIKTLNNKQDFVKVRVLDFWKQPEVEGMSASGLRGTQRLQKTVPFGANWFKP